jgi:hypothetical protein
MLVVPPLSTYSIFTFLFSYIWSLPTRLFATWARDGRLKVVGWPVKKLTRITYEITSSNRETMFFLLNLNVLVSGNTYKICFQSTNVDSNGRRAIAAAHPVLQIVS